MNTISPYEWMDQPENRAPNGTIDASGAMAVRKEYGWSQQEVFDAADQHRSEEGIQMRSTFPSGTYDLLHTAHRWGQTPAYLASVLGKGMTEALFVEWLEKWALPVPDAEYTDSDTVTAMMAEEYQAPHETCWECAGLEIPPEYMRPA